MRHRAAPHRVEPVLRAEGGKRAPHAAEEGFHRRFVEQESGLAVPDGFGQSSGLVADRQRAEALRIHLAQPAGLEARRHQRKVAARKYPARLAVVESDRDADRVGPPPVRLHQGIFDRRLAAAGDDDLPAGLDDLVRRRKHEIDALLVHETSDEAEDRPARDRQPELLADIVGIGLLAFPVAGPEGLRQLGAVAGIPAFIDAVQDSRELMGVGAKLQHAFQPAAELGRGDLLRIIRADGGQMRGVDQAALEERKLVVEFETVDVEGILRCADPPQRVPREDALVGEVMDGQDRGDLRAFPGEIGRRQSGLPVIGVDEVGCPIPVQIAHRQFRGGGCQPAEPDVVVGPVAAALVAVRVARPVVELRTQQHIDRQPVPRRRASQRARRQLGVGSTLSNDFNMGELFDDVPVARQDDPYVAQGTQGAGQGGGNGGEPADADEIVHLRGDKENLQSTLVTRPHMLLCKIGSNSSPLRCAQRRDGSGQEAFLPRPCKLGSRRLRKASGWRKGSWNDNDHSRAG
ncbi:hypothetical protein ES703_22473 [subsurface metagenome]